jgi:cytochrome c2
MAGRIVLAALIAMLSVGCGVVPQRLSDEAERGRAAIRKYGCGSCHTIAGLSGAHGLVGPPLTGVASRAYLAGRLHNTPGNMARWIRNPRAIDSMTAMPVLGVGAQDASDITHYLQTLR